MGCGGSRADAIEPRYQESWTRETESTWLTNTDAENPNDMMMYRNRAVRGECGNLIKDNAKLSGMCFVLVAKSNNIPYTLPDLSAKSRDC